MNCGSWSEGQLQPVQTYDCVALAHRRSDDTDAPQLAHRGGADFDVDGEAALVPDGMGAQPFELRARVVDIKGKRLLARDALPAHKAENVVDSARPDQGL